MCVCVCVYVYVCCHALSGNGDMNGRDSKGDKPDDKRRRDDSRDRGRRRSDSRDRDRRRRSRSRDRRSPRRRSRSRSRGRRRRSSSRERRRRSRDRDKDKERDNRDRGRDRGDRDRDRRRNRDDDYGRLKREREQAEKKREEEEARKQKEEDEKYRAEVAAQAREIEEEEELEEKSAEQLAEERRKKRAAIMAKFKKKKEEDEQKEKQKEAEDAAQALAQVEASGDAPSKAEETVEIDASKIVESKKGEGDDFDLFSDDPEKINPKAPASRLGGTIDMDSFTDSEGYYVFRPGDMLTDRFRVIKNQGRGVFSTVLRVQDTAYQNRELVVKIVRGNETMYKAGIREVEFLKLLASKDPEGKKHCVRLLSSFEHRNHLCMVFEPMNMNLRELLRKLGHVGLSVMAIQAYAKQLFVALKLCKLCQIVHGDIKPDNILVNKDLNYIKLCDFGSAGFRKDAEITPYLCSRFYRAPEIMLGIKYDEQSDIWSIGCVLYELYTAKILYPGKNNNDMLRYHMEYNGNFPKRLIKKGKFKDMHFDENQHYLQVKVDPLSKLELKQPRKDLQTPNKSFLKALKSHSSKLDEKGRKKLVQLADLLTKMFNMDPQRRLTVEQCLQHPFIKE
mmetsp:Transcript_14649/g.26369  ORF Transcript_14649/g.26369 Transcript_14649/m.26369 type:complete len:619 (+) Transcript_14649:5-1861(+)